MIDGYTRCWSHIYRLLVLLFFVPIFFYSISVLITWNVKFSLNVLFLLSILPFFSQWILHNYFIARYLYHGTKVPNLNLDFNLMFYEISLFFGVLRWFRFSQDFFNFCAYSAYSGCFGYFAIFRVVYGIFWIFCTFLISHGFLKILTFSSIFSLFFKFCVFFSIFRVFFRTLRLFQYFAFFPELCVFSNISLFFKFSRYFRIFRSFPNVSRFSMIFHLISDFHRLFWDFTLIFGSFQSKQTSI